MGMWKFCCLLLLAAGCVSTSYRSGNPGIRGAKSAIQVDVHSDGRMEAFGKTYRRAPPLARDLRNNGAGVGKDAGRAVLLRCADRDALGEASRVRAVLQRNGVSNMTVVGPRTSSAEVTKP